MWLFTRTAVDGPRVVMDAPAPPIVGTTLDGSTLDLASYAGRPVLLNFWGPSCIPCRDEFPLFVDKLAEHGDEGLAIIGVLTDDPAQPARDFVAEYEASWPTVEDPDKAIKAAYRVVARPHTFFIDREGIVRGQQIGELLEADFDRFYARIAP